MSKTLLTALCALALACAPAATAHAATGTFSYVSPESGDLEIVDPDPGECYLLLQGAATALNGTNGTATLFDESGCEEIHSQLAPGQSGSFTAPLPRSVMFH